MIHIISHNDLDGYSAVGVIRMYYYDLPIEEFNIKHYNYDRDVDLSDINDGDTVFITDYSLTNDEYHKILDLVGVERTLSMV